MSFEQTAHKAKRTFRREASSQRRGRIDDARGYIYLLRNDAFQVGWVKIGKTSRSGRERADDLNREAGTGYPGRYQCIFEVETLDRHRAEKAVFGRLKAYRQGQQELFIVEMAFAEQVIREECSRLNHETLRQVDEANAERARELRDQREAAAKRAAAIAPAKNSPSQPAPPDHQATRDGMEQAKKPAESPKPNAPSPDPRISGKWVTPDQAAAAWAARRTAQADRANRDAFLPPREANSPAPRATNPYPEFKWILVLIAALGIVVLTL